MAYVTSSSCTRVVALILCLFCARGLAQFEDLLGEDDGSGNITLIPPDQFYSKNYSDVMNNVTCQAKDCFNCTYQWIRNSDERVVSETPVLNIGQLGLWNSGNYTCTAYLHDNESSEYAEIGLQVEVTDTRSIDDVHLTNDTYLLRVPLQRRVPVVAMFATCTPLKCAFAWMKDSRVIHNGPTLDLGNMTYSDAGPYTASASIGVGKDKPHVSSLPLIITDTDCETPCVQNIRLNPAVKIYNVIFGDSLPEIECRAECYPFCQFQWIRYEDKKVISKDAIIKLNNLTGEDFGFYQCIAFATEGKSNSSAQFALQILYSGNASAEPFTLDPNITTLATDIGKKVREVTCSATCSPFECVIWWVRVKSGRIWPNGLLSIGNMTYEDIGYYTCYAEVKHTSGSTKYTISLTVTDIECSGSCSKKPRVKPPTSKYTITAGESIPSIECRADCSPPCNFYWTLLRPGSQGRRVSDTAFLELKNLKDSDFGQYECVAYTNTSDRAQSKYTVTITKPAVADEGPGAGVIVGAVLGSVAGVALILGIILYIRHKKRTPENEYTLHPLKEKGMR